MTERKMAREIADALTRECIDRGQIIEGGWKALEILMLKDASDVQRTEMRKAYFFGAQHLWASVMGMLEPGLEPTELDMERMDKIHKELEKFVEEMKKVHPL
jgi:hypothetical protein